MDRTTCFDRERCRWVINTTHHPLEIYEEPGERIPRDPFMPNFTEFIIKSPPVAYIMGDLVDRLAAYENTGLEPLQIKDLAAQLEKEKRQNDLLAHYGAQKFAESMKDFKEIQRLEKLLSDVLKILDALKILEDMPHEAADT